MRKIKQIIFAISLIVLIFSAYQVISIGWGNDFPSFLLWSVIGAISLTGVLVTYKSIL